MTGTPNEEGPSESATGDPRRPFRARTTGVFLGIWVAVLLFAAFVVVPQLFAGCIPQTQ